MRAARPVTVRSVVVVGAGLAGSGTVAALRNQGFAGHITLLGAEGVEPYDRPPLSKQLLERTEPAWLRDQLGTDLTMVDDLRLDEPARRLHLGARGIVVSTDGGEVEADALVLATGAHAVRPPTWTSALTLHTAGDATLLRQALRPGTRLVVVGAGWIGAEVAGVAAGAGEGVGGGTGVSAGARTVVGVTRGVPATRTDVPG